MSVRVANILPPGWADVFDPDRPRITIGFDPATTTKKKSNPSAITVTQQVGLFYYARLVVRMKTSDPDVIHALLDLILTGLRARGLSVRKLVILATNERFFAVTLKKKFAGRLPVKLLIESENIVYQGQTLKVKAYLGNLFVNTISDGYLPIPSERFVKDDLRQVVMDRGTFDAEVAQDGGHGDVFASTAASLDGQITGGGPAKAEAAPVGTIAGTKGPTRRMQNPHARRFIRRVGGRVLA
jgi:hypothetical protein